MVIKFQFTENTTKNEAEEMRINRVEHLQGLLHGHNTRHWTLSWPKKTTVEQFRKAVEDENLVERFFDQVVKALDVDESKVAMLGYIMTRPIPHCHVAITSSRSGININRKVVKDLKDFWVELVGNTAKCSAFNLHVWLGYMTGYDNMLKSKQRWMEIPISNPNYIEGRRRFLMRRGLRQGIAVLKENSVGQQVKPGTRGFNEK